MKLSSSLLICLITIALLITTMGTCSTAGDLPGKGEKLTLAYGQWIGEHLPDWIIKILLEEELGFEVKKRTMGTPMVYKGIEVGEVDLFASTWLPNQKVQFNKYQEHIEVVGTLYDKARQGWLVPTWFSEKYDVTSIKDLQREEIAEKLDLTGDGKADLVGGPSGWLATEINNKKLEEYGLTDQYKQLIGQETMLNYTVRGALQDKKPVLFYGWTPDWFFAKYPVPEKVVWLKDPYGYWPPDSEMEAGELGWPPNIVHIIATEGFSEKHSAATKLLNRFNLEISDVNRSIYLQTVKDETSKKALEKHARDWIKKHQKQVEKMLQGIK
ncbi:MAG: glycine betaine ABC transporter substrate-binding protein [Halanaerobiales bacterium]|nr:glycine betaine ABC transporter substrate-binding protein [Halanaerobiales bacterium]